MHPVDDTCQTILTTIGTCIAELTVTELTDRHRAIILTVQAQHQMIKMGQLAMINLSL